MPRSVVTQLMFEGKAEEAMTLYVALFGGSVTAVEKYGPGEPGKEVTVKRAEFTVGRHRLSEGGVVLMPPNDYGFSRKFAWLNDRFGVSWQINLA
jgi:predicted 3-demethylubiquinone-9 3-methyltransferase (glyoxalase superfamily)